MSKRALVLCSGGLDSVIVATMLKRQDYWVSLLFVRYGSKAQVSETAAVLAAGQAIGASVQFLDAPGLFGRSCAMLAGKQEEMPSQDLVGATAWVPARNLVLVSLATVQAVLGKYDSIAIGNVADGVYSDNKPIFTAAFNALLPHAVGPDAEVKLLAPVNHLIKPQVIQLGVEVGAPLEKTWSCFFSGDKPCGKCGSCISRLKGYAAAGLTDPAAYAA